MKRSAFALMACALWMVGTVATPVAAPDPPTNGGTQGSTRFDIDAQPLAAALRQFSEASGIAVLVDDTLVAGKETRGLHGLAAPHDALRILLLGTGLVAHFSSMNAFTVTADHAVPSGGGAPAAVEPTESDVATLQHAMEEALCARADTRPGTFRLALQLWVDGNGLVTDLVALAPSDDAARDARVVQALHGLHVPARLATASPVTVLLAPSKRDVCGAEGAA